MSRPEPSRPVSVRLPPALLAKVDAEVSRHGYRSRGDAVRAKLAEAFGDAGLAEVLPVGNPTFAVPRDESRETSANVHD